MTPTNATSEQLTPRWWPAILILTAACIGWFWAQRIQNADQQVKNITSLIILGATLLALATWLLLLSRMKWATRGKLFGCGVVVIAILIVCLRFRGVTGDFVPVLEWRWTNPTLPTISQTNFSIPSVPVDVTPTSTFPQLYGPARDGQIQEPRLARDWKKQPPQLLWRQPIGPAWSGFAIWGPFAVTLEQRGEQELVNCYHTETGDLLWSHADDAKFFRKIAGEGPRSVPTIADGRVYSVGATGILNCLSLQDGISLWSRNFVNEVDGSTLSWGMSCSPLVLDNKVIVSAGGKQGHSLLAYDTQTGDVVWSGGDNRSHYSSPVIAELDDRKQVIIFNQQVVAHDVDDGRVLWTHNWPGGHPHVSTPVFPGGNRLIVSSGYGTGCELIEVVPSADEGWTTNTLWQSNHLKSKFANLLVDGEYVYGLDNGILVCLKIETGDRQWKRGRYGHGQLLMVDDLILIMAENGEIVLVDPTPETHRELTRYQALDGKTWNPPALSGDRLIVRNDKEAACYRLPTQTP